MKYFGKYVKRYWGLFSLAVLALGTEAFCDLLQPTIMAGIVDTGILRNDMSSVFHKGFLMLGIAGFGALAAVTRNLIASNVSQQLGMEMRSDLFRKIIHLSREEKDSFGTASLITRMTNDITQVQNFSNGIMRVFVKAPLLCVGSIIMASFLDFRLALIVYTAVITVALLIFWNLKLGFPLFAAIQGRLDGLNTAVREYLGGIRAVKAFNNSDYENNKFLKANGGLCNASIKAMRVMAVFTPSITLTVNLSITAILWVGGLHISHGGVGVGKIIAFVNYMTQILMSLGIIANAFNMFIRAKASAVRISEVMDGEPTGKDVGNLPIPPGEGVGIEFQDVIFTYPGSGEPALRGVSFMCGPGESLGIIGSTGSGKSTLISLILRFYEAGEGSILLNGMDIREYDEKALRGIIAVVPQRSLLFTGSILENIRWGKEDASLEEVTEASAVAQADSFITGLPEGYGTWLGQGGVNLSGGQKQRIAIARALVKKPRLLILDDSTSAVDISTESRLREGLTGYSVGMNTITVAQRITSVIGLDRILVLDDGRVAGLGTHSELMASCAVYQDIYGSQLGGVGNGREAS